MNNNEITKTNPAFSDYVRSTAFSLNLNNASVQNLLFMLHIHDDCASASKPPTGVSIGSNQSGALLKRGLVNWDSESGGLILTHEGVLVGRLLIAAGFKTDKVYGSFYRGNYTGLNPVLAKEV